MTAAEMIAELAAMDPETLVLIEQEHHGWWSLEAPNGFQDKWVVRDGSEYKTVAEGAVGAARAVRIW